LISSTHAAGQELSTAAGDTPISISLRFIGPAPYGHH
jgi:hypothetical protein